MQVISKSLSAVGCWQVAGTCRLLHRRLSVAFSIGRLLIGWYSRLLVGCQQVAGKCAGGCQEVISRLLVGC